MRSLNNESLNRKCNNSDWEGCSHEYFSANNRNQFYCSQKCRNDFNNRKKRALNLGDLPVKDGVIIKLQSLMLSNVEVFLTLEQIYRYGIDIVKYDERTLLDGKNQRFVLRFGDFYFYRVEDDLFRIINKNKNKNYGSRN